MANDSSTAFGFRPLKSVGQQDYNAGLGEWMKGSGSAAIYHNELCYLTTGGVVLSATVSTTPNIGVLNGSFYTDPTSSKPTWSNYAPSVAASDHTCLINDNPQTMFEMRTNLTSTTQADAGGTAPLVDNAGSGAPNYISGFTFGTVTGAIVNQVKLLGITRDTLNQDVSVDGSVWRVMICSHILAANAVGI